MITAVLFGLLGGLLLLAVPVAIALAIASTVALLLSGKVTGLFVPQSLVTSIDSFPLMAVPFFILAGELMGRGGLSVRLINVGKLMFGRYSGGLGIIAVVTCMFFAAISGSGPATVAAVGSIMLPSMLREGYHPGFATGLVSSAGALGIIIPPSIPMVIYATSANVSVSKMFMAGIIPGLLIGGALILYTWVKARRDGMQPMARGPAPGQIRAVVSDAKWALLAPVIILGGIYGGIFTPTEAAAVGVIYGFVVGTFIHREIDLRNLYGIIADSALTTATVMLIVGSATIFGRVLTLEGIPALIAGSITEWVSAPWLLLLVITLVLLVIGTFMEALAAIIILTPILLPLAVSAGLSPEHFGILMIVNLAIGMVTPPVGVNLFVASRVAGVPLEQVVKGAFGPILVMVAMLLLLTYVPGLTLWLPAQFGL